MWDFGTYRILLWAMTCDFQQCGIFTSVDSDEPVQPPFKLRNSKWCSVSSITLREHSIVKQRLWSDCAYAHADWRLCWWHIPHYWKSHVAAHMWHGRLKRACTSGKLLIFWLGRIAQSVMCLTADLGVASSIPAGFHTLVEIDHEIISMAILLPSADSRRLVVSYKWKYVHEVLV